MQSMRKIDGVLTIAVALLVLTGTSGCQSGWKFSNPFSHAPKASDAEAPGELDDDFAEVDDITPPPENYTVGDSVPKQEKKSIAQKGKYGDEEESHAVAATDEPAAPTENFATPSYAQTYQSPTTATSFANGVGSSTPNDARQPMTAETLADTVAGINPDASIAAASQPYVPQNAAAAPQPSNVGYPTNGADQTAFTAQNQAPAAAADPFPTAPVNVGNPIAQVSAATPNQPVGQPQRQPASVAFNYDAGAPAATPASAAPVAPVTNGAPGFAPAPTTTNPDQYSDVIYTPQTTSTGFAPGSVLY